MILNLAVIKLCVLVSTAKHQINFPSILPAIWYRRMGLSRRMGTTSRPPVPRGLYEHCNRQYLGDILEIKTKYSIPPALILNSDQTPSSYLSVGEKKTMAACGSKSIPTKGLMDKCNITLNSVISLSLNNFCHLR